MDIRKPDQIRPYLTDPIGLKPDWMRAFVNQDSEEWYSVASLQVKIPTTSLTLEGKEELENAILRAEKEKPKLTLINAAIIPVSAGPWEPDKDSVFYDPEDKPIKNCMNDRVLVGFDEETIEQIQTTQIMWQGTTSTGNHWVITKNGNLYYFKF